MSAEQTKSLMEKRTVLEKQLQKSDRQGRCTLDSG